MSFGCVQHTNGLTKQSVFIFLCTHNMHAWDQRLFLSGFIIVFFGFVNALVNGNLPIYYWSWLVDSLQV